MLQDTLGRVADPARFAAPLVICNDEHRFIVAEQLREAEVTPQAVVLEPEGRNTAPAAALAAIMLEQRFGDALIMLLPSDHVIAGLAGFHEAAAKAAAAARDKALVAFGMAPDRPETGYGYIRRGEAWDRVAGCYRVELSSRSRTPPQPRP